MIKKNTVAIRRGMLVGLLLVGACGSKGKESSTPDQQVTYKLPDTTKIVSPEEQSGVLAVGAGGEAITLDGSSALAGKVAAGDVLVFGIGDKTPHGLLRKVVTKSVDGTNIVLATTPAKLEDAFQELHFAVHQTVDPATMQSWTPSVSGLSVQQSALTVQGSAGHTFDVNFDNTVLYDYDGDPATTYDQVVMSGSTSFSMSLDLEVDIGLGTMDRFKFGSTLAQNGLLTVSTNLPVAEFKKEMSVATLYFPPFVVGPVVIVPQLELIVGAEGKLEAQISTAITESVTLEGGIQYQAGQWQPYQNVSAQFTYTPPTLSASGSVKAYAGPSVNLLIYDVAGPYVQIDGYLELKADISGNPWWELDAGVEGFAGATGKILGFVLLDYQTEDFIGYQKVLAQAKGPFMSEPGAIEPGPDAGSRDLGLAGDSNVAWEAGAKDLNYLSFNDAGADKLGVSTDSAAADQTGTATPDAGPPFDRPINSVEVDQTPSPPAAPALISPADTAQVQAGNVTFSWGQSAGAARYHLMVCADLALTQGCTNPDGAMVGIEPGLGVTGSVLVLGPGTYFWAVRAIGPSDIGGWGPYSPHRVLVVTPVAAAPDAGPDLAFDRRPDPIEAMPPLAAPTAVSVAYQQAKNWNYISWTPAAGATAYVVYWGTSPGVTSSSNALDPTNTTDYGHSGVQAGWTYYYRVAARNAVGQEGPLSTEVSVWVPPPRDGGAATATDVSDLKPVALAITPLVLDFTTYLVGCGANSGLTLPYPSVTLANTGDATTARGIGVTTSGSSLSASLPCDSPLSPGQTCPIHLSGPTTPGVYTSTLTASDGITSATSSVTITIVDARYCPDAGVVNPDASFDTNDALVTADLAPPQTDVQSGTLTITPSAATFEGWLILCGEATAMTMGGTTFTVTNSGAPTGSLSVSKPGSNWSMSSTCAGSLSSGSTCTVQLQSTSSDPGVFSTSVTVSDGTRSATALATVTILVGAYCPDASAPIVHASSADSG
jgi:hypothetical protein